MKRHVVLLLFALLLVGIPTFVEAQELSAKSFSERSNDLTASTTPRKDNNGVICALVKVQIASAYAKFEGAVMGDVEYKTSEYWVYMPAGSKRLTIKVENYLPLSVEFADYGVNALESKRTYLLVISGIVLQVQAQEPIQQMGYLMIESEPSQADVYLTINGQESLEGQTPFQKKLAYGTYALRLSSPLFHDETMSVVVDQPKVRINPQLKPAFGYLSLSSNPSGAKVTIEGVPTTFTTPCTTEVLASGTYTLRFSKEKHATVVRQVEVEDGKTIPVSVDLQSNFAPVTISSLPGATISINGNKVGTTSYTADLTPGLYDIEVQLANHHAATRQIEVEANKPQTIGLNPIPISGSLEVQTTPFDVSITIDGKDYGTSPITIDHLPIGQYEVKLTKKGYKNETVKVTVEEGKIVEINRTLVAEKPSDRPSVVEEKPKEEEIKPIKPRKQPSTFVLATAMPTHNVSELLNQPAFGLTVGHTRTFGWYVNAMCNLGVEKSKGTVNANGSMPTGTVAILNGEQTVSMYQATAGIAFSLSKAIKVTVGAGYGARTVYAQSVTGNYYKLKEASIQGVSVEGGLLLNMGFLSVEASVCAPALSAISSRVGIGINF